MEASRATTGNARGGLRRAGTTALAVLVPGIVAAVMLIATEPATIASIDVGNDSCEVVNDANPDVADRCELSGFERHGGAFLLLGALVLAMTILAARTASRGAAAGLIAIGILVLAIALLGDLPKTDDVGATGPDFDNATADAGPGLYGEFAAALLCVVTGVLALRRKPDA